MHGAMLMLRDPCEEIAALLARLSSVQRGSEQGEARAEHAWSDAYAARSVWGMAALLARLSRVQRGLEQLEV